MVTMVTGVLYTFHMHAVTMVTSVLYTFHIIPVIISLNKFC